MAFPSKTEPNRTANTPIINADGFEKLITDLTIEDIWGLVFDIESQVCEFYAKYAKCYGFVSQKDLKMVDANGNINTRQLVCNKIGERHWKHLKRDNRQREHRAITRVNCRARIRFIRHYRTGKWKVSVFESEHNHLLCPPKYRHLIAANRGLNEADKTQADSLRACGVKTCHIMGYMVFQKGVYDKVGFTSKDLHNHISKIRRGKVKVSDVFAALAYLLSKADSDPLFLGKFTLNDGRLDNLVWADGASIVDYECFGDVLAFETTYKKNVYNKPLVIFLGTNIYGQTTIFGWALLSDERSETFKLVLKEFLKIMSGKLPGGVVIDRDRAMREAILEVFPGIPHRFTVQIFEERWNEIISKYGFADNKWVQGIYNDKMKWANAYLREHFFGRIRITSQCEGIHSLLKNYLPVLTTCLEIFEKQATEFYAKNIFKLVKDEIEAAGALNVTECPNSGDIVEYNTTLLPTFHIKENKLNSVKDHQHDRHLTDHEIYFIVAILGLLVNLVEKDGHNRSRLAVASVLLPCSDVLDHEIQKDILEPFRYKLCDLDYNGWGEGYEV
ncbi:protein FAR1-RELATED SEQUENCE 5-like [Arachis hypogaea]|uniref:protein FAR1-RELATED SEQUENCE 5-like n=1 Tax=Arachis hypogaea TaxID=3818 RepID=UPI000DECAC00|nr:protein FAR1-RELATED SEQUENCE 5-like [Arachis hypogaea]